MNQQHSLTRKMRKTLPLLLLAAVTALTGCTEELEAPAPGLQEKPAGIVFRGSMPGNTSDARAYVDERGGFFWNAGDSILVTDSYYSSFGAMFTATFSASPESDGKKKALFQFNMDGADPSDMNTFLVPYLQHQAKDYSVIFPQTADRGDDPRLGATYNYSFPPTRIQEGATSRHLGRHMLMTSGRIDIDRTTPDGGGLTEEDGFVRLPDFRLKHRTSLLRLRIMNRQQNPIRVKRVSVMARKKNGSTAYFLPECSYYLASDSVVTRSEGAYGTLTVQLRDSGTTHCTIPAGDELSAYASLLPVGTEDVTFTFVVETDDTQYKTLAFDGNLIEGRRFEAGTYYTFELLVDHNLSIQGWEENLLNDISFGQETFTVSTGSLTLPLEGGQTSLRVETSQSEGWHLTACPEWLATDITAGTQGVTNIRLSAPSSTAERNGTLCFAAGNLRKWISVRQANVSPVADDAITVTANEINAPDNLRILQDDEPSAVYCDAAQRSFNTARPLQISVKDGRLHVRFYSPRKLEDVEIWAKIPALSDEEFLLARFEEVAPFIDYYTDLPFLTRDCTFRTASGKQMKVSRNPYFPDAMLSLRATGYCPYWRTLEQIKHGWNIAFSLYGGDPTKPDGGPSPNWIGIRPVHCREAVALFLNLGYIFNMKELEDLIYANEHKLYGNGGTSDPVSALRTMKQMREEHSLRVGLVSPKHSAGLGGPGVFGLEQWRWLNYHDDWGASTVVFHELGHVLGYNHSSSFTNGPWAHELMSNFYLKHRAELPVNTTAYLDSKNNPNLYK